MIIFELLYLAFTILLAALNAQWIKEGKTIHHFWNGLIHLAAAVTASLIWWWPMGIAILCNVRVFFDSSLNLLRGLPLNYVSLNPKSIVDKIEKKIFGSGFYAAHAIYLCLSLLLNCIYLVFIHK